ncbi:tetratricopeptide repeat protein [Methanolobus mangrovi]|uniref:Tetratricopeptide repeat protein n=1 Tax=Methanolobus mangrovi TaxID=3072977 RepID=A0AA51UDH1_9EURY|nr:tetratricopeptide repeat protein [Methanolobus mangrovi]WMW21165.1 tetratricopeptide repeat protein [Methanolobus mangrovi]
MDSQNNIEEWLTLAEEALTLNEQIECYEKALAIKPDNIDIWIKKINRICDICPTPYDIMSNNIDLEKSISNKCNKEKITIEEFELLFIKAKIYDTYGKYDESVETFDRALNISPDIIKLSCSQIIESFDNVQLELVDIALELKPNDTDLLIDKAWLTFGCQSQVDEGIEYFNKAVAIKPNDDYILKSKASYLNHMRRYNEALETVDLALAIKPEDTVLLSDKACYLNNLSKYDEALETVDLALAIKPEDTELLMNKICYLINLRRYDDLLKNIKRVDTSSENINHLIEKIRTPQFGSPADSPIICSETYSAFYDIGTEYFENNNLEKAFNYFNYASKIKPDDADIWIKKGDSKYRNGNYGQARIQYNKATKVDPKNAEALYKKGLSLDKKGEIEEAKECIDKALKINPNYTLDHDLDYEIFPSNKSPQALHNIGTKQHKELDHHLEKKQKTRSVWNNISYNIVEADEGEEDRREVTFRKRNSTLIKNKKSDSDYRCEVCGISYEDVYGEIGKNYIIAHHIEPIGNREGSSKTTHDDIALLCSNCHNMVHRTNPPMTVEELRSLIQNI